MNTLSSRRIPADTESCAHPRLALIGPVMPPFRGGIAQYTAELHRALSACCRLQTISFRRLYPAWLYPGDSDREPGIEQQHEPGVHYVLDAINPLTWLATATDTASKGCDLAVINWWTLFWAPGFALMANRLRARGVPVAFICHNLFDHDSGSIKRGISTRLLSQADAYLVHASEQAETLRRLFPGKPVRIHPHPTDGRYPPATAVLPKRGRLELLFFGFIRPYKGLDVLVDALGRLADHEVHLTVVGEPWCAPEELREYVRASGAPNVELHLEYVDANTAANFFARADLVVLPYRSATGSAVAAVAYHYEKPILATRVGGLPDVVEDGRTGFLVDPDSPRQLAARLHTINREELASIQVNVQTCKNRFTWCSLAGTLIDMAHDMAYGNRHDSHPNGSP